MKRYNLLIIILIFVMIWCSCCSYKETFTIINPNIDILNLQNRLENKLTDIINNQNKTLDKLNYTTGYKKLYTYNVDKRISQIDNINTSDEIIEELKILGLDVLYKNEIKDLENNNISNLNKYKNVLKTKYLIDNNVITEIIDDKVYEEIEFTPPESGPKYPDDTNELYYVQKFIPFLNKELGSKTNKILKEMKISEIESRKSIQPEIYIMKNGEIDKDINKQIYLNKEFADKFKQSVDEYNIEFNNIILLKNRVKKNFEEGFYLNENVYNIKRSTYEQEVLI